MPDWQSIPQLVILTSEINLKFFSNPRGAKPTCNTHLTAMKSGTEIIVWSNVNVLYTIPWVHFTTFDPELRNERFTLISFMGFPAILSALWPFQICICNRKNRKFTFSNGPQLMGIMFMANLYASLDSTCKSRTEQISTRCQIRGSFPQLLILNLEINLKIFQYGGHSTTFDPELRNERFTFIPFMRFPVVLSTLQPFQICICNRKNRKFTFSNGSQPMGKRSMANLHASLDSTCKVEFNKFPTDVKSRGAHSTTFDPDLRD